MAIKPKVNLVCCFNLLLTLLVCLHIPFIIHTPLYSYSNLCFNINLLSLSQMTLMPPAVALWTMTSLHLKGSSGRETKHLSVPVLALIRSHLQPQIAENLSWEWKASSCLIPYFPCSSCNKQIWFYPASFQSHDKRFQEQPVFTLIKDGAY